MGTDIVSLLLITIPYQARWLYWLSVVFFVLDTILFSLAFAISFLRYTLYPEIWGVMIKDATNSLFLGTVPMGFAMLAEAWIFLCTPYWSPWATSVAWVMWMVDSVFAAAVTLSLGILMYVAMCLKIVRSSQSNTRIASIATIRLLLIESPPPSSYRWNWS